MRGKFDPRQYSPSASCWSPPVRVLGERTTPPQGGSRGEWCGVVLSPRFAGLSAPMGCALSGRCAGGIKKKIPYSSWPHGRERDFRREKWTSSLIHFSILSSISARRMAKRSRETSISVFFIASSPKRKRRECFRRERQRSLPVYHQLEINMVVFDVL